MLDWLKGRFPERATREQGVRMLVIGIPVTVVLALSISALLRFALTALGGM